MTSPRCGGSQTCAVSKEPCSTEEFIRACASLKICGCCTPVTEELEWAAAVVRSSVEGESREFRAFVAECAQAGLENVSIDLLSQVRGRLLNSSLCFVRLTPLFPLPQDQKLTEREFAEMYLLCLETAVEDVPVVTDMEPFACSIRAMSTRIRLSDAPESTAHSLFRAAARLSTRLQTKGALIFAVVDIFSFLADSVGEVRDEEKKTRFFRLLWSSVSNEFADILRNKMLLCQSEWCRPEVASSIFDSVCFFLDPFPPRVIAQQLEEGIGLDFVAAVVSFIRHSRSPTNCTWVYDVKHAQVRERTKCSLRNSWWL